MTNIRKKKRQNKDLKEYIKEPKIEKSRKRKRS